MVRKLILKLFLALFLGIWVQGCAVVVVDKKDNGKHKGWTKNSHNPHHPNSTNPGKAHGKGNGKAGKKHK